MQRSHTRVDDALAVGARDVQNVRSHAAQGRGTAWRQIAVRWRRIATSEACYASLHAQRKLDQLYPGSESGRSSGRMRHLPRRREVRGVHSRAALRVIVPRMAARTLAGPPFLLLARTCPVPRVLQHKESHLPRSRPSRLWR